MKHVGVNGTAEEASAVVVPPRIVNWSSDRTRLEWQTPCFYPQRCTRHVSVAKCRGHTRIWVVKGILVEALQAHQARVSAVSGRHARSWRSGSSSHVLLHLHRINGADGISSRPHGRRISRSGCSSGDGGWIGCGDAVLASTTLSAQIHTAGTLSAVARTR